MSTVGRWEPRSSRALEASAITSLTIGRLFSPRLSCYTQRDIPDSSLREQSSPLNEALAQHCNRVRKRFQRYNATAFQLWPFLSDQATWEAEVLFRGGEMVYVTQLLSNLLSRQPVSELNAWIMAARFSCRWICRGVLEA